MLRRPIKWKSVTPPSVQAIDGVSDPGTNVQGISLADSNANYVPQLSEEGAAQVRDAISAITANNKAVGFAFIDLQNRQRIHL